MSVDACAEIVRRSDPDRFAASLAAPVGVRARLWPIYAFNLEVARAPFVSKEPLIAEMRLQFWADAVAEAVADRPPRAHQVAAPLAAVIRAHSLSAEPFLTIIAARRRDVSRADFDDDAALIAYLDATAGSVMGLAARVLGAQGAAAPVVAEFARAAGLANWLLAVPALRASGQDPLPRGSSVQALASRGLSHLRAARARRAQVPAGAAAALLTGWQAGPVLARACRDPAAADDGRLASNEIRRRGGLLWRAWVGRW